MIQLQNGNEYIKKISEELVAAILFLHLQIPELICFFFLFTFKSLHIFAYT